MYGKLGTIKTYRIHEARKRSIKNTSEETSPNNSRKTPKVTPAQRKIAKLRALIVIVTIIFSDNDTN